VDLLSRDPNFDCDKYCRQLYTTVHVPLDAAVQLQTDITHVQRILRRFSANLIVRQAQVAEDLTGNPDAYLRNQLYVQSGQKLCTVFFFLFFCMHSITMGVVTVFVGGRYNELRYIIA